MFSLLLAAVWTPLVTVGKIDGRADDLAFGPAGYARIGADPTYVEGISQADRDWSYVLPGPSDAWAGNRVHTFDLRFGIDRTGPLRLRVGFLGGHPTNPATLQVRVNGQPIAHRAIPNGQDDGPVLGQPSKTEPFEWDVEIPASVVHRGNNGIEIVSESGSWVVFDGLAIDGQGVNAVAVTPELELSVSPPGQLEVNTPEGPARPLTIRAMNVGPSTSAELVFDGKRESLDLPTGATTVVRNATSSSSPRGVLASLQASGLQARARLDLEPVRPWHVFVLPGGHVDIGYTHPQAVVAEIQANNVRDALRLIEETRSRPPGERYRWNSETAWAAEQFLLRATPDEKRRFATAVRNGELMISASYANLLYGLVKGEEAIQALTISRRVPGLENTPHDTAMLSDVPGFPWRLATALKAADVRNFVLWPNAGDSMRATLENRPFWWTPQDGQGRVFVWPMFPYSIGTDLKGIFHMDHTWWPDRPKAIRTNDPARDYLGAWLSDQLAALNARNYPYDIVGVPWSMGDNGALDLDLPDAVAAWNRKYANPKLEIATVSHACSAFLARYGKALPTRAQDFNPQWEDGAASSANSTARNRHVSERLAQAQTVWSMSGKPFPAKRFDDAWKDVLLFSEHTWGADESIRNPDGENTRRQWITKSGFTDRADRESQKLLGEAIEGKPGRDLDVVSTVNRSTTEIVKIDGGLKGLSGQRLADSSTAVQVTVKPLGVTHFFRAASPPYRKPEAANTIDNGTYRVTVDPRTGAVASLFSHRLKRELAGKGFGMYQYILGRDVTHPTSLRDVKVECLDAGPVVWTLRISGQADGVLSPVTITYTLGRDRDMVGISVSYLKEPVRKKEIAFLSMPFALGRSDLHVNGVDMGRQRFPSANDQFFTVDRTIDISDAAASVTVAPLDTPIVVHGRLSVARLGLPQTYDPTSPDLQFQLMQNHWHVNYRAEQDGIFEARFALRASARYSPWESALFGERVTHAPVMPKGFRASLSGLPFAVSGNVLVSTIRPLGTNSWLVRLQNPGATRAAFRITGAALSIYAADANGGRTGNKAPRDIPAYGVTTLRVERRTYPNAGRSGG